MPVISNNWTTGHPFTTVGNTGAQSIVHIPATRAFIKAPDSTTAAPVLAYSSYSFKTNGIAPTGWVDLGPMSSTAKLTYTKSQKKVQMGIDKVTRLIYVDQKDAMLEFDLMQLDDYILGQLGFTSNVYVAGSVVNFQIGQEDVVNNAMLVVYDNKADGKEVHYYHPSAALTITFVQNGDQMGAKVQAELPAFTAAGASKDSLISCNVFA